MSTHSAQQRIYELIDQATDTASWADLARQLEQYATQYAQGNEDSGRNVEVETLLTALKR